MKKLLLLPVLLLFALANTHAATNYVLVGQALQPAIDASAPGDTLVIQAGVYPDSPIFNKALTVLRSGTNQIQLLGAVQITGAGNSSFQFSQFASAVTIQATGTVSFAQTEFLAPVITSAANVLLSHVTCLDYLTADLSVGSGTNFQAYDSSLWQLDFTGGKTLLKRCSINKEGYITLALHNNAAFEGLRVTNNGYCFATATVGSGTSFVAAQSTFRWALGISGYKVWLGYNDISDYHQQTNCDAVLIGNRYSGYEMGDNAYRILVQGGTVKAYNNLIRAATIQGTGGTANCVILQSTDAEFANNTWLCTLQGGFGWSYSLRALYFTAGGSAILRGNLFSVYRGPAASGNRYIHYVWNTSANLNISYCDFFADAGINSSADPFPGVGPMVNNIFADPVLDAAGNLGVGSACINAGPPDPIYNDRDGTRNDMGYTGGPYWNPANYTNDNPMVFFLTGSPQTVLKGVQTNITVNAAASAGH